jgi:hypothetical protein
LSPSVEASFYGSLHLAIANPEHVAEAPRQVKALAMDKGLQALGLFIA